MMARVIILAVFLGASIVGVYSFSRNCYLCNSYSDSDHDACVDPMSPYPEVNHTFCPENHVCTRVSYITEKQFIVERGCDPPGNTCENIHQILLNYYPDLASFVCYACDADYCNDVNG